MRWGKGGACRNGGGAREKKIANQACINWPIIWLSLTVVWVEHGDEVWPDCVPKEAQGRVGGASSDKELAVGIVPPRV